MNLSVLVPVYNEQYLIEASLSRLIELEKSEYLSLIQVIVVDDCSNDQTPVVLERLKQELPFKSKKTEWLFLRHNKNQGKGKAIQTALKQATCELTVIHDADLEYYPKDLLKMIPIFINERADAVFGSRFSSGEMRKVLFYKHQLGNAFLTFLCNLFSDYNLTDMETCYKMIRTDLFKSIPIDSNDFRFEPEIILKLSKRNASIFEIPISYCGRTYSEGKKINWRDGYRALWAIIRYYLSDNIYTEDKNGSHMLERMGRADNFNRWMADTVGPYLSQNVLEIGAGIGTMTRKLIPRHRYVASDINPLYIKNLKNFSYDKPYLSVTYFDINDLSTINYSNNKFDTIICLNVLEHIENDKKALSNIFELLNNGGKAIVLVPHMMALYGSFDKVLGHKRRYNRNALIELCKEVGFNIIEIKGFNRAATIAWLINGRIFKRKKFGLIQIFMLNVLTPLFRLVDRLLPIPPQSIIAVLEKK